ncbi:LPXTG-domain-containing protein cell wall anchor domain [Enterococcus caccae]|nr:LPXTG-domain-containing protein cell wall anchor domain [Enterococcus caccae]
MYFRRRTLEMKQKKWTSILAVLIMFILMTFTHVDHVAAFELPQPDSLARADRISMPGEVAVKYQLLEEDGQPIDANTPLKIGETYLFSMRYQLKEFDNNQEIYDHNIIFWFNEGLEYAAESFYVGSNDLPPTHLSDEGLSSIMPDFPNEMNLPFKGSLSGSMEVYYYFKVKVGSITGHVDLPGLFTGETSDGAGGIKPFSPIPLSLAEQNLFVAPDFQMPLTVSNSEAKVGDILTYTLTAENNGGKVGESVLKNSLPEGVDYLPNTTKINDLPIDDSAWNGREFAYSFTEIPENEKITFTYQVKVTGNNQASIDQNVSLEGVTSLAQQPFTLQSNSVTTTIIHVPTLSSVTTNFKDQDGTTLKPSITLTGDIGTNYEVDKEIAGYQLKEVLGDDTGIFTEQPKEITYIYEKVKTDPIEPEINNVNKAQPQQREQAQAQLPKTGAVEQNTVNLLAGMLSLFLFSLILGFRIKNR